MTLSKPTVAFGPVMNHWGSWDWAGQDIADELAKYFATVTFQAEEFPQCDVAFFIKHAPPPNLVERVARRAAVIYCPVDYYGSPADIEADGPMLRRCTRILVHSQRLCPYFRPYAPVEYIDHYVKFAVSMPDEFRQDGYVLWVGVRSNLPALIEWVNRNPLPCELRVLTNLEDPSRTLRAEEAGFQMSHHPWPLSPGGAGGERGSPGEGGRSSPVGGRGRVEERKSSCVTSGPAVRIENWMPHRQIELTAGARAAIDIKGDDFRARHKPPAKGIDFIASGLPLAMNPGSSTVEHLAHMGFELASPLDTDRWFSREYWHETRAFGAALRELLSRKRVGRRYKRIVEEVLGEVGDRGSESRD